MPSPEQATRTQALDPASRPPGICTEPLIGGKALSLRGRGVLSSGAGGNPRALGSALQLELLSLRRRVAGLEAERTTLLAENTSLKATALEGQPLESQPATLVTELGPDAQAIVAGVVDGEALEADTPIFRRAAELVPVT